MISDTLVPLAQLAKWLGLDLWKLAGINRNSPNPNINKSQHSGSCSCYLEYSADSGDKWSREDLKQLLKLAEESFLFETGSYVAPYQILDERSSFKNFLRKNQYQYTTVEPHYPCGDLQYGLMELINLGDYELVRDDGVNLLEEFSVTFQAPISVNKKDLRMYYTEGDLIREYDLEFNNHRYEIRPFSRIYEVEVDANTKEFTIYLPAYLLVKPSLFDSTTCLAHELNTYVSEVNIVYEQLNTCNTGYYIVKHTDCGDNCDEEKFPACYQERTVYKKVWAILKPVTCTVTEGGVKYTPTCLSFIPEEVEINYLTGYSNTMHKNINEELIAIIAKQVINFMDCVKSFCACETCNTSRIEYYRSVQKDISDSDLRQVETTYQLLIDRISLVYADGLKPTIGVIQVMRELTKRKCNNKAIAGKYV